jgi:hypothetical protein
MVTYGESEVELGTENKSPIARRDIHGISLAEGLERSNRSLRFPMPRTWHCHQYQVRSCGKAHLSEVLS